MANNALQVQQSQREQTRKNASDSGGGPQANQMPSGAKPFVRSAFRHRETGQNNIFTLSTSQQQGTLRVPTYGYLNIVYLTITGVTAANAATVVFQPDAPWNILQQLIFRDTNGTQFTTLTGFNAFLMRKWGGYRLWRPENSTRSYSVTSGVGAGLGGSFSITFALFPAFGLDGRGVLPNMDASAQYQVDFTLNTIANVYSTAPTTPPTVTVQISIDAYSNPPTADLFNNPNTTVPPNLGTVQYWTEATYPVQTGDNTLQFSRVGNLIRNHFLIFRNTSGVRTDVNLPTGTMYWELDNVAWFNENTTINFLRTYEVAGFDADTGVMIIPFDTDPDYRLGGEFGDEYVPTLGSTKEQLRFTSPAAGTITIVTNDIVPVGDLYNFTNIY